MCPSECHAQWRRHFDRALKAVRAFNMDAVDSARQQTVRSDMDEPPSLEELETALAALKNGKVGGKNGLIPNWWRLRVGTVHDE